MAFNRHAKLGNIKRSFSLVVGIHVIVINRELLPPCATVFLQSGLFRSRGLHKGTKRTHTYPPLRIKFSNTRIIRENMKNTAYLNGYNSHGEALRGIMRHSDVFQFAGMASVELVFIAIPKLNVSWG